MSLSTEADILAELTVQMRTVLDRDRQLSTEFGQVPADDMTAQRNKYRWTRAHWNEGGPSMERSVDGSVQGPLGEVPIRVHYPIAEAPGDLPPALVFIHGGGYIVGDLDTHDRIMRTLAARTGAVVIGVDYRLSPESVFPGALDECVAVVDYVRAHGRDLGIEDSRIGIAGDSAGAQLSLGTALVLRDRDEDTSWLCALLLFYGQFGLTDSASRRLFGGEWDGMSQEDLAYYNETYLGDPALVNDPRFDCLRADLSQRIPPCYIAAADLDPLLDDSIVLADILAHHGIPVRLDVFEGVLHAFLHFSSALDEAVDALEHSSTFFVEHTSTHTTH